MGEVWRGRHEQSLMPVAVKLLSEQPSKSTFYHQAFRREMRAVASLNHANVVHVYDYGTIDGAAESRSMGRFSAGSPYLVMELVEGGSIGQHRGRLGWGQLRQYLLELLAGLAHAHARGIIHRDIKFGNVLIGDNGLKLADFGLAHATLEEDMGEAPSGGTPTYMAPEQFQRNEREYGPWTDLYAVGCMAWILVSGKPPFREKGWVAKMHAHLTRSPPPLVSRVPLPVEFEAWLRMLMRKDPRLRFRHAADAAHALAQLREPISVKRRQRRVVETIETDDESTELAPNKRVEIQQRYLDEAPDPREREWGKPLVPADWREAVTVEPYGLFSAGLGLFGFRAIPVVGRETERDQLWAALRQVCRHRQAHVLVLTGAAGSGKTFLAEWLCRQAHECGAAVALRTTHQPVPGPNDGLARLLSGYYQCRGLFGDDLVNHLEKVLIAEGEAKEREWLALAEMIAPSPNSSLRFESPRERYALVQRTLARIGVERPLVVFADDAHWGVESLELASHILKFQIDTPLLFVISVTDSIMATRPREAEALAELEALDGVSRLSLEGLDAASMSLLIREMLQLGGDLPDRLQQHVGGNPRYAVQLVSNLIRQGVLIPGERGLELSAGAQFELPDDEYGAWHQQLERGLLDLPDEAASVLEMAVVLGTEVLRPEWELACEYAGIRLTDELVDGLVASFLIREDVNGWRVAHQMLADLVERRARESSRWRFQHACCARAIRSCYPHGVAGLAGRIGRHMVEAGDLEQALQLLADGVRERMSESDYRAAHALLDYRARAEAALALEMSDPRVVDGQLLRAELLRNQGIIQEANEQLSAVAATLKDMELPDAQAKCDFEHARLNLLSERLDDAEVYFLKAKKGYEQLQRHREVADCILGLGETFTLRGAYDVSLEHMEEARNRFLRCEAPVEAAWARRMMSRVFLRRGELKKAEEVMGDAMRTFETYNQLRQIAHCRRQLSIIYTASGRYEEALSWNERALALFDRAGDPLGRQSCLNGFAEIARFQGRLQEAERGYRAALTISRQAGTHDWTIPKVNLGLVLLLQSKFDDARVILQEAHSVLVENHRRDIEGGVEMALAICAMADGQHRQSLGYFESASKKISETGILDPDIAGTMEMLADQAAIQNKQGFAQRAMTLAVDHWSRVGDEQRLLAARKKLAQLESG